MTISHREEGKCLINTIININLNYEQKFTMLLASAMLATAFSAGAAVDAKKRGMRSC